MQLIRDSVMLRQSSGIDPRLPVALLFLAVILALFGLVLHRKKTVWKTVLAVLSGFAAAAALLLTLPLFGGLDSLPRPVMQPEGDPQEAAAAFSAALERGDREAVEAFLPEGIAVEELVPPEDAALQPLYDALLAARGVELRGEAVIDGLCARQGIHLRTLDLSALQKELNAGTESVLRDLTKLRARRDLADEEGHFLRPASQEAWRLALSSALLRPEDYYAETDTELELICGAGGWCIVNAPELLRFLNGGGGESDLDAWAERSVGEAAEELVYTRTIYTVPEEAERGPAFDRGKYVYTNDPAVVQEIVESAAALLDGQELCWNASIQRLESSPIVCYCDETILVICWKEVVNYCCLSFCEVKIAHGSQLRRALAGGEYRSGVGMRIPASRFSTEVNAVASINGDFYDYRKLGITVYQREVYRNNPERIDSCFFTADGDMLFAHRGELTGEGEAEQFVLDNDVVFGLAFGPILVENGEATHTDYYPLGEVNGHYSRSVFGQLDELHYLLMTCGFGDWYDNVPDINQTARYIQAKGVDKAYALDGGGTAEICVDGRSYNYIDFNTERPVSDIVYFVTALPEETEP